MHEAFEPLHEVRTASPRAFGWMLVVVFALIALIALWPLFAGNVPPAAQQPKK